MRPWSSLSYRSQIHHIRAAAKKALPAHLRIGAVLVHKENSTFRLMDGDERQVLRIHRNGYHDAHAIRSELAWVEALRRDGLPVPVPVPWPSGDLLLALPLLGELPRWAVRFRWIEGKRRSKPTPIVHARRLGRLLAMLHEHAAAWERPPSFTRPLWTVEGMLGPDAIWGNPRNAVNPESLALVDEACDRITEIVNQASLEVALVHHDFHGGNLLHRGGKVSVIDFDDCGFGYLISDWMIPRFQFWHQDHRPQLNAAFDQGYREIRLWEDPNPIVVNALDVAFVLRGLAWLHTRSDIATLRDLLEKRMETQLNWVRGWITGTHED